MMTAMPGRSAASAMVFAASTMRLFCGMAVEFSAAYNAAWICPLAGIVLCIPLLTTIQYAGKLGNDSPWRNLAAACPRWLMDLCALLFGALLIYDCSVYMRLTASTANYVSLSSVPLQWLILPLCAALFLIILFGSDTEGNSVRIWLKMLPLLLLIVIAVQFKSYTPSWLTPVLGGGLPALAEGGLYCGGWLALLVLPWILAVPDRNKNNLLRPGILASLIASGLLIVLQMLCPTLFETRLSELARAEIILSNNRVAHTLQMFLTLLWFGSLLHLISIEALTAACFVRDRFPKLPRWFAALVCSVVPGVIAYSDFIRNSVSNRLYRFLFIIIASVTALMMCISIASKDGDKRARA